MPPFRTALALGVRLSLAAAPCGWVPALRAQAPGTIVDRVECGDEAGQSYALYLPSAYDRARAWPIIFCFDALALGRRPVEHFQEAAERFGYIVVGSNNSRNGPWAVTVAAANALLRDTNRRFRLDHRRCYASGFSGGARAACAVAAAGHFAGVIACSGGFPGGAVPRSVEFAFFGTAGREDFNYQEMQQVEAALAAQPVPHRLAVFAGGHEWLPPALAVEAVGWLELQAMRSGLRPRDDALVGALLRERLQPLAAAQGGEAYLGYRAVAADFGGLTDVAAAAAKAAALKDSPAVRAYFKAEKQTAQEEERWLDRLFGAAEAARPSARPPGMARFGSRRPIPGIIATGEMGLGTDAAPDGAAWPGLGGEAEWWTDGDSALPDVIDELRQEAKTTIAARRALAGAYVTFMAQGSAALEGKDGAAAIESLEVAALIRPEAAAPLVALTRAHLLRGEKRAARRTLQAAIGRGFGDAEQIRQLQAALGP